MRSIVKALGYFSMVALMCQCVSVKTTARHEGWESMFNGRDIDDWTTKIHHYEVGDNYGHTFRVEDEIIKVRYDAYEGDFN
ncbi:MAG: DUF1080 domain-containing protein, partial [Maribacter sp.]|nr:DUF1080 domain-containing protein [Maribacter sp.]